MDSSIIIIVVVILALSLALMLSRTRKDPSSVGSDKEFQDKYNLSIPHSDERPVKITKLFLYPVRGIPGLEVESVKMTRHGLKYDRNWAVFTSDKMFHLSTENDMNFSKLRQRFVKEKKDSKSG